MNRAERRRQKKLLKKSTQPNQDSNHGSAEAQEALQKAIAYHQSGQIDEAMHWYKETLKKQTTNTTALGNLGSILQNQGKLDEAIVYHRKTISINPDNVMAHSNLGVAMQSQGKLDDAVACFQKAITIKPDFAEAHNNLGFALKELGRLDDAVSSCKRAITLKPDYADAYNNLGYTLLEQKQLKPAVSSLRKAVAIKPGHTDAYYNLGVTLQELGEIEEAVTSFKKAVALKPDHADAYSNLGVVLQVQGDLAEAISCYEKAISLRPNRALTYRNLSIIKKYREKSEIDEMIKLLPRLTNSEDKMHLNFALGKAMADIKRDAEAFDYFNEGNKIERATLQFDIEIIAKLFTDIKQTFNKHFFESRVGFGCKDSTPIFILGMPRSGSTLIEQILSSHTDVYGAGELSFIEKSLLENMSSKQIGLVPDMVSKLTIDDVCKLGESYIKKIRTIEKDAKFITDKMPMNFIYTGVIKLMLPNAKIIHSVRLAEDTCLSIFRTKFTETLDYACDLKELGQYYRLYYAMMQHWNSIFPGEIYDCHYEKLTGNQEEETRKLLDFCNLEWSDDCLSFHTTVRDVNTASNYQVRQPMYTSSVNGWKRFEKQLQPLIAALGDLASEPINPQ
ncbi:MAG: tetratricopeptide repeat protein [Magnetococcales bacterium]|nr:tetratricopeptide repeat protein [Magnetococcales bacterium]